MNNKHDLHNADGTIERFCTKCKTIKKLETEFSHKRNLGNGQYEYHSICRECRIHYHRKRNYLKGHKPTLSMRKDKLSQLEVIDEKIKILQQERDRLLKG